MVIQIYVWSVAISLLMLHLILKKDVGFLKMVKEENRYSLKEAIIGLNVISFIPIVNIVLIFEILRIMYYKND